MTEKLKQIIKEEVAKLPKELQDVISSFDWVSTTEEIGKKYLLTESEINDIQVETLLVLVGIENSDSYAFNIENNVETSKEEAEKITEEINQKIFIPINDILVENIKKGEKIKNTNWEQNLNFIISGGDYSAFIKNKENLTPSSPEETPKTNIPINPKKITDLRSKFTI